MVCFVRCVLNKFFDKRTTGRSLYRVAVVIESSDKSPLVGAAREVPIQDDVLSVSFC